MNRNVIDQLVTENEELLLISNRDAAIDQSNTARQITKIERKKDSLGPVTEEAIVYIAKKKDATKAEIQEQIITSIKSAQELERQSIRSKIIELRYREDLTAAAAKLEQAISKAIDNAKEASTAKERYEAKKDPTKLIESTDAFQAILDVAKAAEETIGYINAANSSRSGNTNSVNNILR